MPISQQERSILEYALKHLEIEKARFETLIADVEKQLGKPGKVHATVAAPVEIAPATATRKTSKKRTMSPEGKARLIAALKKRWAAHHKAQATTEAPEPVTASKKASKKKPMSPEARAKVAAAQKKRWAAFHKAQGTAPKTAAKKATKKAAKKTGKKKDNSDIPF